MAKKKAKAKTKKPAAKKKAAKPAKKAAARKPSKPAKKPAPKAPVRSIPVVAKNADSLHLQIGRLVLSV